MPQIIRKERTAHLASYTFLQEMLINIKTRHFHSSINHQEYLFQRTLITSYFQGRRERRRGGTGVAPASPPFLGAKMFFSTLNTKKYNFR